MGEITSRDKVLSVHMDAWIRKEGKRFGVFIGKVQQINCGIYIGSGATEAEAWDDAANQLPSAPSPAEETASERIWDRISRVAEQTKDIPRWKRGLGVNKRALPEPVSPEVIHVPRIPGTVNTPVGPMIPAPVSPEGSAERLRRAAQSVGVIVVKDKESLASQVEAIRLIRSVIPESAAPIAPAAEDEIEALINEVAAPPLVVSETAVHQLRPLLLELIARRKAEELIQELRRGLSEAAMSLHTVAEQAGREEELKHMDQVRGYANSRANAADAALTRAEEYRKGAKNV